MKKHINSLIISCFILFFNTGETSAQENKFDYGIINVFMENIESIDNSNLHRLILTLNYDLNPGWHIYWKNPGQAGIPPTINWNNNSSISISSSQWKWKIPERFYFYELEQSGYLGKGSLPYVLNFKYLNDKKITLSGELNILICSEICIPVTKEFSFKINPTPTVRLNNDQKSSLFYQVPEIIENLPMSASLNHIKGVYSVELQDFNSIIKEAKSLFIEIGKNGYGLLPQLQINENGSNIWVSQLINFDPIELKNIFIQITAKHSSGGIFSTKVEISNNKSSIFENITFATILLSLLAGIILNLMPCSFPVLTMKVAQLAKGNLINRANAAIGTIIGILFAALSVAFMLILLKKLGGQVGWGLHFQSPWATSVFSILFFLFSISMFTDKIFLFFWRPWLPIIRFGEAILLKINSNNSKSENKSNSKFINKEFLISAGTAYAGFWIATPCGAPILGSIIVISLLGNNLDLIINFSMVGIGMAIPYIILQFLPINVNFNKKLSRWFFYIQKVLAVFMILAAIWFASIAFKQFDYNNNEFYVPDEWEKFNESKLQILKAEGKTILVHITADWCLTCKVNNWNVYSTDKFKDFIIKNNVILFWQDWTKKDNLIRSFLAKHGRFSLPFDVVYNPKLKNKFLILPEILTFSSVKRAIIPIN